MENGFVHCTVSYRGETQNAVVTLYPRDYDPINDTPNSPITGVPIETGVYRFKIDTLARRSSQYCQCTSISTNAIVVEYVDISFFL